MAAAALLAAIAQTGLTHNERPSVELLRQQLEIFGLHAVRLDLREDSARLTVAAQRDPARAGLGPGLRTPADEQVALLSRWLEEPRPTGLSDQAGVTVETSETWALFRLIARAQSIYGIRTAWAVHHLDGAPPMCSA